METDINPTKRNRGRPPKDNKKIPLASRSIAFRTDQLVFFEKHPDCFRRVFDARSASEAVRIMCDKMIQAYSNLDYDERFVIWSDCQDNQTRQKIYAEADARGIKISDIMKEKFEVYLKAKAAKEKEYL